MAERYNFKYLPLVGKLPGKSMVEQTETAINELASVVYDNVGYVGNLAEEVQTANTNASNALDKATEALETSGRVYIKQIAAVDVNDYYDSELYYINNDGSTNIPVRDRGFLEVKTNDDKTACEQVFIADSTGTPYYRHGRITEQTLGEETTYVVTWSSWYRVATTEYVQGELTNYLPLRGGTLTGGLTVEGTITGNLAGNADTATNATNATNDANGNPIASTYLPLAGGTITGLIQYVDNGKAFAIGKTTTGNVDLCWNWAKKEGAGLALRSTDYSRPGEFFLFARDANNTCGLTGKPDGTLTWDGQPLLPVGIVQAFAGTTIPNGWLLCDGSAVSRTDYAALYAVIRTTYGAGNGSTTFNLPNLVDKFVEGSATSGTVKSAGLLNITGGFKAYSYNTGNGNGAFTSSVSTPNVLRGSTDQGLNWNLYTFDASRSDSIYGKSTTVQPPALTMRYIIKY